MVLKLTLALVLLAMGYVAGIASVPPPKPIVRHVVGYQPAGLQLTCSKRDLEELQRVCRARSRMEKVK